MGREESAAVGPWLPPMARALVDSTSEGIVTVDLQGRCTFVNASAGRMLGYDPEAISGANLHALVHHNSPDGSPHQEEACPLHRAFRTGEDYRVVEEVFWRKDGSSFPVECTSRPLVEEGEVTGTVVTFFDLTERKRAGEALRASNRRAENILESITDAFLALNGGWRFTYLNSEAERFLQRRREDLFGKNIWEEFPELVGSVVYDQYHRALSEHATVVFEWFSLRLDAWFEIRVYPTEDGLAVYFRNIDQRKRAEEDRQRLLRHSERRAAELDAVIQSIPDAVYIGNESGISMCNDASLEMLGFENLDELNQNIPVLSERLQNRFAETGERIPPEEEPFVRALRGETVIEEVVAQHQKTKEDVTVRCSAAPICYGGKIVGAVAVNTDITASRQAEEKLRESEIFARSTLNSLSARVAILDETGLILATNRAWQGVTAANPSLTASTGTGANYLKVCDTARGEGSEEAAAFARGTRDVISGRQDFFELEYPCHSPGKRRWFVGRVTRFVDTNPPKVVVAHENVTERKLAEEETRLRVHQQEAVANFGRRAIAEPDLSIVMDDAVEVVSRTLKVEYVGVAELLSEGDGLLLRAGVGWKEGLVGSLTEKMGTGSQAGYTLLADEPVLLEDLASETRFDRPPLLQEHGVASGMSTVIRGHKEPFGVLAAYTSSRRVFTESDVNFLCAVANVLGEAIEWRRSEERMGEIREVERSRMGRDLHDGPLQDLTYALAAAQLAQSMTEGSDLDRWLQPAVEALKRTGQELRAAVYDLRLEEESGRPFPELVGALVELNRRMAPDRHVRFEVAEGFPSSPLKEKDSELLRILQEALTNARRHSEARNVVVSLGVSETEIWAEVADDGRGFRTGTAAGVGLESMRERASILGGNLEVESKPGKGTRVRFAIMGESSSVKEPEPEQAEATEIRVLLVEDHASFREATAAVLEREPGIEVVGHAGSLAEAREMIDGGSVVVDVAIVDLGLPDGYGGDLIKELRQKNPRAQTLVVSSSLDQVEIARAVEAGAAGFLHKSVGMDEVVDALRRVRAGDKLLPLEEVVELLRFAGHQREQEREARQAASCLTPREIEVLRVLADGLDGKKIAERLGISDKTERNHMASILTKLGAHSRLQALVFALRYGLVDLR